MPTASGVFYNTDTSLSIIRTNGLLPLLGLDSQFADTPHPGTSKLSEGWRWDKRVWATELEINNVVFAPTTWDPSLDGLSEDDFQSGIGDNFDCLVEKINVVYPSGQQIWAPLIQHGYYYRFDDEGYLFSDDSVSEVFQSGVTVSGLNYLDFEFIPKAGTPIIANKYKWNGSAGEYDVETSLKKKVRFTGSRDIDNARQDTLDNDGDIIVANIDTSFNEMIVDYRLEPPRAILNSNYILAHGALPVSNLLDDMETLGIANGINNEEFHTAYSPVLSGIRIISYSNAATWAEWIPVSIITASGQCQIDYDLGIINFGNGVSFHPNAGDTIAVYYESSVHLEYEPEFGRDTVLGDEINLSPLTKTEAGGFVHLKRAPIDPYSIVLTADAPLIGADLYGPVNLGSNSTLLKGTVRSASGDSVEGAEVTFNLLDGGGTLGGGAETVDSLTDFNGVARTTFAAPRNIAAIGGIGSIISLNDPEVGKSSIFVSGVNITGDSSSWYIYKVFKDDPTLGIESVEDYYINYFSEEDISGPTALSDWENPYRLITGLLTPTLYSAAFRNGKKQLLSTWSTTAIHPHTFVPGAFIPVRPESYSLTSSGTLKVVVSGILDTLSSVTNSGLAGYFVAGPTVATINSSVYNERLGTIINSNEIQLDMRVPPSMDGTVLIEALNSVELSGIFGTYPNPPSSGILPLGFRLKSSGVTLAGVLNGLTYLDINRYSDVLTHSFTVVNSGVI